MPQILSTNIASLNAQRNLNGSQSALSTSLQRLSSGMRINSAKDDAAGLAISNRFTAQINGSNQAARNASDGISLAQTAEGDLTQIGNNLQRIRELAVQAANATNSGSDRAALQEEAAQLLSEIDRVAQNSAFNGVKLLDGSFTNKTFQVGADAGQTIQISSLTSARTRDLGQVYSAAATGGVVTAGPLVAGDLTVNGKAVAAASGFAASNGRTADSAYAVAAAINAAGSEVTATANSLTVAGATTGTTAGTGTITINGVTTSTITIGAAAATNRAAVADAINAMSAATGVVAVDDGTGVDLIAADGRNIVHSVTQASGTFTEANAGIAAAATARSTITLSTSSSAGITLGGANETFAGFTNNQTVTAQLTGQSLALVDISSAQGATDALRTIDSSLTSINSFRGALGAYQNRFASVVSSLQTTAENLTASRSRILDADFAAETAALTKNQVLQQAGVAILAQANALPNSVLALLRG